MQFEFWMQIHHQRSVSILKLQLSRKKGTSPVAEQYTIPLWEHYCKEMDYDFYWQKDLVHEGYPLGWNIPIIWREFVAKPKSGWKFVWLWTWDSMPVVFDKGLNQYSRSMVIGGDRKHPVSIWCPSDCDDVYSDVTSGCHGPLLNGCIARTQKKTKEVLGYWWGLRDKYERQTSPWRHALSKIQVMEFHNDIRFWDAQQRIGKFSSSEHKVFEYSKDHGRDKMAMVKSVLADKKLKNKNP